jgi:hypothetical protein
MMDDDVFLLPTDDGQITRAMRDEASSLKFFVVFGADRADA